MAKVKPAVTAAISKESMICVQLGSTTMSEWMKIARDMSVIGRQSFSASHMVRMKEAPAILAATAAVSDVPQTASRNAKECAIQGSTARCPLC